MTPTVRLPDIFRLMLGSFVTEIAAVVLLHILFEPSRFFTIGASGLAGSVWWLVGYQKFSRTRGWESLQVRFSPVGGRMILASAVGGLTLIGVSWVLAEILELAGIRITDLPAEAILPNNLRELPLAIAVAVVLVPLVEELIFRGLLLDWLRQKIAVWPAALAISLLFAFLHNVGFKYGAIGWIAFVERFLLGMGALSFAIRHRSLRAPFVMHATLNGCACLASVLRSRLTIRAGLGNFETLESKTHFPQSGHHELI